MKELWLESVDIRYRLESLLRKAQIEEVNQDIIEVINDAVMSLQVVDDMFTEIMEE